TSGAFTWSGTGDIDATGQSDFSMHAFVDFAGGSFGPENQCGGPDCPPGTEVSLEAIWTGLDLRGSVRFKGQDYVLGQEGAGGALGIARFQGTVTLPDFTSTGTVDVSA